MNSKEYFKESFRLSKAIVMFEKIFVEKNLKDHDKVLEIKQKFSKAEVFELENYEEHFGKFRKPYLQKRNRLNLYIANKKGKLLKEAPEAYGLSGEAHYYYIHAYNCIYECEYCYLQGYFKSPDIVLFLNHEEIQEEMTKVLGEHSSAPVWFHAGEFSDSLALSHLTGEIEHYYPFFRDNPLAKLELRTKSANIRSLLRLEPLDNVFTSFSLGAESQVEKLEHKTAGLNPRLKAMAKLQGAGHKVAVHFDPVVYSKNYLEEYSSLILRLKEECNIEEIEYFSLGVVRFTKDVFRQVSKHYPDSSMLGNELISSFDGKVRYLKPLRMSILKSIEKLLISQGVRPERIYLCME